MAKKMNISQFKSKIRQQERKINQEINKYNRAVKKYNNDVKHAVNDYNRVVRQHNANVMKNRSRIQSELRKLSSTSNTRTVTTYSNSVAAVNSAYQNVAIVYDTMEPSSSFQEHLYSGVEQENANNLVTANVILDNDNPIKQSYSLQETQMMNKLSTISPDLDSRWKGALFSLNPNNPDATRHFCTSTREIFTEIFDTKAIDEDVFAVMPDCGKTERGNASRRSKIKYFLLKKGVQDSNVEDFIDKDIENILELFHTLGTGTHGKSGVYTISQLSVIKERVEDGLIFLCDIVL